MRYSLKSFPWSSHAIIARMLKEEDVDSIFDVGSSDGFLGQRLTYKPKKLCAIDKTEFYLPQVYSLFWKEDLDRTNFSFLKDKTFRAIILADVVEHLKKPEYVVSKLKQHLDNDGFFIFSFPNMGFFMVKIFDFFAVRPKMERGLYDQTHIRDFDLKTANVFLENLGFGVLDFRVTPVPLPLFSNLFKKGRLLFFLYKTINFLAEKFPSLFAYQLIFKVKIK